MIFYWALMLGTTVLTTNNNLNFLLVKLVLKYYGYSLATIEAVRVELAEILEEHIFLSIQNKKPVKGFSLKLPAYA